MISKEYLAGFVDGEGCFNITRCRTWILPRLLITNTNVDILKQIKGIYGGDISSRKNGKDNWKVFNMYRASCKALKTIIKDILPYLILKREQAELCLEMMKTKDIDQKLNIKERMHILNKRGI